MSDTFTAPFVPWDCKILTLYFNLLNQRPNSNSWVFMLWYQASGGKKCHTRFSKPASCL